MKLVDQVPFHEVLFHGLICDPNGKKMSKSLGNIIDPMDVIDGISLASLQKRLEQSHLPRAEIERAKRIQSTQFPKGIEPIGSDGLRLCLLSYDIFQQAIRFDPTQFDYVGRYCNKIWNAYKYVTEFALQGMDFRHEQISQISDEEMEEVVQHRLVDRWMFYEMNRTISKVNECLGNYQFHTAIVRLRDSFLKDFCDFYIEFSKIPTKQQSDATVKVNVQKFLYYLLKHYLILYHPFLPAMTEELWADLTGGKQGYLIHQLYPTKKTTAFSPNPTDARVIDLIRMVLKNTGYFKQMLRLPRDADIVVHFHHPEDESLFQHVETYLTELRTISRLTHLRLDRSPSIPRSNYSIGDYLTEHVELIFNLNDDSSTRDLVNKHEERLSKQVEKYRDDLVANDAARKMYEENQDQENLDREQRRRETLIEDLHLTERRHERFVQLTGKRTIPEKKSKESK